MFTSTQYCFAIALSVGLAAGLVYTPIVQWVSRRLNFVDKPDGDRKHQKSAIALGGGLAVYIAMMTGVAASFAAARAWGVDLLNFNVGVADRAVFLALLQGSVLILVIGLIDDKIGMRGRYKLLGQLLVACLLVNSGLRIDRFGLLGEPIEIAGWLAWPVTVVWLIVTINAINLIDGIDGLASSVGTVLCLSVAGLTAMQGHTAETFIVLALAGAQLGFLRYNFAPASIYLGDTGSMLIGLVVGVIATHTSAKAPTAMAMAVPFALWSIPILDSAAAMLRRKLTGRSFFTPDRGHLHHSLLTRGWSVRQASLFITLICATTCLAALLSVLWGNELIALGIVLAVVLYLISTRTFGHIEFALIKQRVRDSAASLAGSPSADGSMVRQSSIQLQGSREWDKLWQAMVESTEVNHLVQMKFSINIPALHEVYYASWKSPTRSAEDLDNAWTVNHPLMVDGQKVGHLLLIGVPEPSRGSTPAQLIGVLDFLEPIEDDIRRIREQIREENEAEVASPSLSLGTRTDLKARSPSTPPGDGPPGAALSVGSAE